MDQRADERYISRRIPHPGQTKIHSQYIRTGFLLIVSPRHSETGRTTCQQPTLQIMTFRVLLALVVMACVVQQIHSQITLSKGWQPGKRTTFEEANCLGSVKSTVTTCHILMNELRQMVACEIKAALRYVPQDEDNQMLFTGNR